MIDSTHIYREMGCLDQAIEHLQKDIQDFECFTTSHFIAVSLSAELGQLFFSKGKLKEAEELEVQVMETRKRVLGQEHPSTLTSMANLALTWRSRGYNVRAFLMMRNCFELRKKCLGVDHPDTNSSYILNERSTSQSV
jgi:hypothetical protein